MRESIEPESQFVEKKVILLDNTVYRLVNILGETKCEDYLQIIKPPYTDWISYNIGSTYWDIEDRDYTVYSVIDLLISSEHEVYTVLRENVWALINDEYVKRENQFYIGLWNASEDGKILYEIPKSSELISKDSVSKEFRIISKNENYIFTKGRRIVNKMEDGLQTSQKCIVDGNIWDIIRNPESGIMYGYGLKDNKFGIWSLETNLARLTDTDIVGQYDEHFIDAACDSSDNIFICNEQNLYRLDKNNELLVVSDFLKQGYLIKNIYDMSSVDNSVYLLTKIDGEYCLLNATEEQHPDNKQEIVLAAYFSETIQNAVTRFNRKSDKYHISIMSSKTDESYLDYLKRVQMLNTTGNAPDIYCLDESDMTGYAKNGYLSDLSTILSEKTDILPAALETAKIDGVQYGIPYRASLLLAICSQKMSGGKSSWTAEEMMNFVLQSDAKIACYGDGTNIIYYLALLDHNNKDYIDWELGISHLTEEPFLQLMKFAYDYGDNDGIYTNEGSEGYKNGTNAIDIAYLNFENINYYDVGV